MRAISRWLVLLGLVGLLAACGRPGTPLFPEAETSGFLPSAVGSVEQVFPLNPVPYVEPGGMVNETPAAWFVQFASAPSVEGGSSRTHASERAAFRSATIAARVAYQQRYDFTTLFNGISVNAGPKEIAKIARLPGVVAVWPIDVIQIPEVQPMLDPEMATALAMTGADIAQNEMGLTGIGIKVAVMDTGIDYDHPDLGGAFGPGNRVAFGYDFVGDAFNADPSSPFFDPIPVPDLDPDDCNGHGTHVAGIVGAKAASPSGVTGVAPGVTFGAYRVFGCAGSTTADIMLAAMEQSLADGMDILNMSIGSSFQWPQYPTAAAATRLVNRGMVVVASIGNSGTSGTYAAGAPGLGDKVIGVASYDNTHVDLNTFTLSPDDYAIGYATAAASPQPPTTGTYPMARTGTPTAAADACNTSLPLANLTDQVVLIRRGTCPFHEKALNAQNAGAAAVVLYNNAAGRFSATVAGSPAITIPVVTISDTEGVLINNRLASDSVDMTWTDEYGSFTNATGGLISSFSSYGLSPDLQLKPDIGAPGGLINSTYPLELGAYATISGTSMSSPHVAGAVALLLEARPRTPAQAVRGILQNSADPKNWSGNPGLGYLDNVHRQGAGMLDIAGAILSTTKIEPAKISAGESETGSYLQTLWIENGSDEDVTYDLSYVNALSTGANTFAPGAFLSNARVDFGSPSVTVPAGGSASATATIVPATGPVGGQYGGYIVFTPQGGGLVYRVPFAGYVGDYQARQVLTPTANGFPWLAQLIGDTFFNRLDGATYTMVGDDVPFFLVHFDHQSRRFRVEIFTDKGRAMHRAYDEQYMPRNSSATGFWAFAFDGFTQNGNRVNELGNGTYYAKISVLKALGDDNNPAHWETWTSPNFTIARP